MRFASLGSGSRGNATLVELGSTHVLVDCGFSIAETKRRLGRLGKSVEDLTAVLVTHEHSDHIGGVAPLARKFRLPVWVTPGTAVALDRETGLDLVHFSAHESFMLGDLQVEPFPVPHDAREPAQFVFSDGDRRLGMLTDTGCTTPHIQRMLSGCHALLLECNHDPALLAGGPYPASLKARVRGDLGHLGNDQAADLLQRLDLSALGHLAAAHVSEKNNTPQLALQALTGVLGCEPDWLSVADQQTGLGWRSLDRWL